MRLHPFCRGRACAPQRLLQGLIAAPLLVFTAGCSSLGGPAEVEWPGRIVLPATFEKAWSRTGSQSGTLVVDETSVSFASGDMSLDIPFREVIAVHWGKMKGDSFNDWAIVVYREAGAVKTAAFKDGSELGRGGDSDNIYSALKYAAEVKNEVTPIVTAPSDVVSGWVEFTGSGVTGMPDGSEVWITFKSKARAPIWTRVTSDAPGLVSRNPDVGVLGPGEEQTINSNVPKIASNTLYRVNVRIYSDAARSQLVERISTGFRFSGHHPPSP